MGGYTDAKLIHGVMGWKKEIWGVGGGHGRAGGGGVWDRQIHGIKKHIGWPDEWSILWPNPGGKIPEPKDWPTGG